MQNLTHHRVKIDPNTKLLINGDEILSSQGIKGNIHSVGVGFGTGRHASGRRDSIYKEVPVVKDSPPHSPASPSQHSKHSEPSPVP